MFIVNVEAAIYKGDKWLIIKRSELENHAAGELSLVGGKVDKEGVKSDILEETIRREVLEEVGVELCDELHYVHSTSFIADDNVHVVDIVFLGEHKSGEAYPKSREEVGDVYWFTAEEILNNEDAAVYVKESIRRAVDTRKLLKLGVK